MEYRKKPVIIEAFRYGMDSRPDWFDTKVSSNEIITYVGTDIRDSSQYYCEIKTLEGIMRGNCGDYIIKGVQGEVYPCKPDIFEMTYELASTSSQTLKDYHIVDTNEMVDQVPDVRKMVDDDKETFLLWVRRNYERCKTGWIDLETGNKHRIEPDLVYEYYQLHPTFSQTEISDEEIEEASVHHEPMVTRRAWVSACKWYREQLKQK